MKDETHNTDTALISGGQKNYPHSVNLLFFPFYMRGHPLCFEK